MSVGGWAVVWLGHGFLDPAQEPYSCPHILLDCGAIRGLQSQWRVWGIRRRRHEVGQLARKWGGGCTKMVGKLDRVWGAVLSPGIRCAVIEEFKAAFTHSFYWKTAHVGF